MERVRSESFFARTWGTWVRRRRILELRARVALLGALILELETVARQAHSDRLTVSRRLRSMGPAPSLDLIRAERELDRCYALSVFSQHELTIARASVERELELAWAQENAWVDAFTARADLAQRRPAALFGFLAGVAVTLNVVCVVMSAEAPRAADAGIPVTFVEATSDNFGLGPGWPFFVASDGDGDVYVFEADPSDDVVVMPRVDADRIR